MPISRIQQSNRGAVEHYYKNTIQNIKTEKLSDNSKKYQIIKNKMESYWSRSNLSSRLTKVEKDLIIRSLIKYYDNNGKLINPKGVIEIKLQGKSPAEIRQIIGVGEDTKQKQFETIKDEFVQGNRVQDSHTIKGANDIFNHKPTVSNESPNRPIAEYFTAVYNIVNKNRIDWKQRFLTGNTKNNSFRVFGLYGIVIIILVLLYFFIK